MPTSSLIDYQPTGHYSPAWGGARRKAQRDSWREHSHSHYLHPAQSHYCEWRQLARLLLERAEAGTLMSVCVCVCVLACACVYVRACVRAGTGDQRGNVRRVTDFDYGFKPRVHDRLVQDLKETCSHPLALGASFLYVELVQIQ
eukprot:COSAG02_NODE_25124_length_668_cov_1.601054_1_plen_143_part_01